MSERIRYTVNFQSKNKSGEVYTETVRVLIPTYNEMDTPTTELDEIKPTLKKLFGSTAFWNEDLGVNPRYGQVFKPTQFGNSTSITGKAWLEIIKGW